MCNVKKIRFIELGWKLMEYKLGYYSSHLVHKSWGNTLDVSDVIYDAVENEYKSLAAELNLTPTTYNMVGFDVNRPSCALILSKYSNKKGTIK